MRIALTLVVLGLAVAGCGGSGDSTDDAETTEASAHQELLAEGDALCAEAQGEAADLARRAQEIQARQGSASDEELIAEAADVWSDQVELAERVRDRLAGLDAPEEDEPRVDELLASLDQGIELGRDITTRLENGEEPPQTLIQSYGAAVAHGNAQARAFGFQVCGRSG